MRADFKCVDAPLQGSSSKQARQQRRSEHKAGGQSMAQRGMNGDAKKMPIIFETAILLVLPMAGMVGGSFCPEIYRGGVINLFRGSHPTLLLSYGTKTRRKPMLLFRLSGLLLLRLADRQFSELLFQLPPRFTRFEPTTDALILQWPPWYCTHFFEILLHWRIQ